ncbi:hypothetical protein KQI01_23120, partial [Vibrio cholerae]|nr:hypothetical protein [Vibrio cholerae]
IAARSPSFKSAYFLSIANASLTTSLIISSHYRVGLEQRFYTYQQKYEEEKTVCQRKTFQL